MMSRFLVPFQSSSRALGDPFSELHREMNRLLDDFVVGGSGSAPGQAQVMATPRMDVREREREIAVCCELPGVKPDDVDIRMEGNVLTIRGEKKEEREEEREDYHVMERSFGRFQRSLQLPFAPNPDEVKADFKDGLLTVHVPKQPEQERSRRIQIQGAAPQAEQAQVKGPQAASGGQKQEAQDVTHH